MLMKGRPIHSSQHWQLVSLFPNCHISVNINFAHYNANDWAEKDKCRNKCFPCCAHTNFIFVGKCLLFRIMNINFAHYKQTVGLKRTNGGTNVFHVACAHTNFIFVGKCLLFRISSHTNEVYIHDEDEIIQSPKHKQKYRSRHSSDGWEDRLIENEKAPVRLERYYSDMDSLSDRNSVLTGKSDIPMVHIHPPSDARTTSSETNTSKSSDFLPDHTLDSSPLFDRRYCRNMGSDRRNVNYARGRDQFPSGRGENGQGGLTSGVHRESWLSPSVHRKLPHDKQNGFVPRTRGPSRMNDVVLATTQKQNSFLHGSDTNKPRGRPRPRPRPRAKYPRFLSPAPQPPPGTTPDKTVFPEKITLNVRRILNPKSSRDPKSRKRYYPVTLGAGLHSAEWNRTNNVTNFNERFDVFREDSLDDDNDDDAHSSGSSWIELPYHSYQLPPGFQDPKAEEEITV